MSENLVLEFFTHQFQQEGRKPATIRTYKSALEQLFKWGFDIQLQEEVFSDLVRAIAPQRPATRTTTLSWSLNKVLSLLTSPEYSGPTATESNLLSKTIFLVTLACGARVSEVSALRRGKSHVIRKSHDQLLLIPSRTFLAKNEDPTNRCPPITLWKLDSDIPLCPVSALTHYLEVTNRVQQDALFIHPETS